MSSKKEKRSTTTTKQQQPVAKLTIGLEINGILFEHENGNEKEQELKWVPDALSTCKKLAKSRHTLYLLSHCGPKREAAIIKELKESKFDQIVPEANWIFVRSRSEKALLCREKALNVMIDERFDVMREIMNKSPETATLVWFRGEWGDPKHSPPAKLKIVNEWKDILALLSS